MLWVATAVTRAWQVWPEAPLMYQGISKDSWAAPKAQLLKELKQTAEHLQGSEWWPQILKTVGKPVNEPHHSWENNGA